MNRRTVTRRSYLAAATVPPSLSLVGCIGGGDEWDGTTPDDVADVCERTEENVWCGEADPISVEESYDDHETWRVTNGRLETRVASGADERWEQWDVEDWGDLVTREYKMPDKVFDHVRDALNNDTGLRSERSSGPHPDDVRVPVFGVYMGGERYEDPVTLEAVRDATPRYVDSTATIEDLSFRQAVPILVTTYENPRADL